MALLKNHFYKLFAYTILFMTLTNFEKY